MKKLFLLGLFLWSTSLIGLAQQKIAEYEHSIPLGDRERFVFASMEYQPNNQTLKILGRNLKIGVVYVSKEGKKTSFASGLDYVPFLYVATLTPDAEANVVEEAIHLNSLPGVNMEGKQYEVQTPPPGFEKITDSETAKSLEALKEMYPGAFAESISESVTQHQLKVETAWKEFYVSDITQPYTYKPMEDVLEEEKSSYEKYTYDLGKDYKILLEGGIVDNKRQLAIAATMRGEKKDKIAGFRNKRIYVTKGDEIINQFDLEFDQPKSLLFAQGIGSSAQDSVKTFDQGAILIYGRASGIGKKNNDPDFTRNYVAMIDADGKLLSQSVFNFGDEKFSLEPYYAFKKGSHTLVFGKTISKDNPGYAVLKFDSNGLVNTESYNTDQIKAMAGGLYDQGITSKYGRNFMPIDHFELANGETLIYGEAYDTRSESIETTMANGQTMSEQVTVNEYRSHVFLRLDNEGKITGLNVVPKSERFVDNLNVLTKIHEVNNKLYLIGEEFDEQGKKYAVIYLLDYGLGQVSKTSLADHEIYDFNGKLINKLYQEENILVFVGKNPETEIYTLKAVVFKVD